MWVSFRNIAAAMSICAASVWAQGSDSHWKDQQEYQVYEACTKEANPAKKIECLHGWTEKYPDSYYKTMRLALLMAAYQAANQGQKMLDTAQEILAIEPGNVNALYWSMSLVPSVAPTNPAALDIGEKTANNLIQNADSIFAPDKKPDPKVSDADWKKARTDMEALAYKTLLIIAAHKKTEAAYLHLLEKRPSLAEASYSLYGLIAAEKKLDRMPAALYHLARAASYTGPDALADANRKKVDDFFIKAYSRFHGSDEGIQELRQAALASALPPAGFTMKNAVEIAEEKQKQFAKEKPQLAFWLGLKKALADENGEQYFEASMKGAALPGKILDTEYTKLKGTLISQKPARNPKELVLGIESPTSPEVTVKLDAPLVGKAEPGTEIQFEGIASAFSKDPFMVTFDVEKGNITGWPAQQAAPVTKKSASTGKKKG